MSAPAAPPLRWAWAGPDQRRAWRRYWVDDVAAGLREVGLHLAMRGLPIGACSAIGARLGPALGPLDRKADARVRANLAALRPHDPPEALEAARLRMWANIGRSMAEFSVLPRLWRSDRVTVHGEENLRAARARGAPKIVAAVHLGAWELLGPMFLRLGEDAIEFYQPPRNRFQRRIADRTRRRFADRLIPAGKASALRAIRHLQGGGTLILFVDDFTGGRVNGPALGRPLAADKGPAAAARFAARTGATVLPAYVVRREGARFDLHILPPLSLGGLGPEPAARAVSDAVEAAVRDNLDQWFMLHELRDLQPGAGGG